MPSFPEPTQPFGSRRDVLVGYLDFFRQRLIDLVEAMSAEERRRSRLPSGWTPIELVRHLSFVELRWLEWGFAGRSVAEPWGDERDGRWYVDPNESDDAVIDALRHQGERTAAIVGEAELADVGAPGPRWSGAPPPTLERVLLHLLQEYARHVGQLDVVAELATGAAQGE